MPDHKISLDVLPVAPIGVPRDQRPSLIARLTARARADKYDRLLSVGVTPKPGSALAAHRARLTSAAERHAIARSFRQAVRDANDHTPRTPSSRVPLNVPNITAAQELIDRVTQQLHSPRPIGALGMARLRLVLSDGAGPLYRCGRGDLPGRLGAALAEL
jgi:hypothetical protein